jgi:general secretion pathway protein D
MTRHLRHLFPIYLTLLVLGCAGQDSIREAESLVAAGRYEEGLAQLEAASQSGDRPQEARAAVLRNRAMVAQRIEVDARAALEAERLDLAEPLYKRLLVIDPNSEPAKAGLKRLLSMRERSERLAKAEELLRKNDMEGAERKIREVLLEAPGHRPALTLLAQIAERQRRVLPLNPELGPEFKKVISLEFREANLKAVFEAIWSASGVNFILDRDVRSDAKVSIFVHNVSVAEAVDAVLITQQLAKKVVSAKTLLIYPKTPQKVSEYQDLVVRNFYLAHAEAKQVQLLLKTILKTKDVFIDEKRNLVVIRDSQEGVDLAEKLVKAHDQAEPEVMLALDVIEIRRSKLNELGISFANQIALGVSNPLTLQALKDLNSTGISVGFGGLGGTGPGVVGTVNLTKSEGDTRLLANPRIRVRNREKAKIHIGDRLPVITTTASGTSTFVGQTVNYLDVGLKLEVEPQVMLDDDVIIKLNLEVSSATQSKVNVNFYDVGTRNTTTTLTIKDGETQILAGLIRDDESEATSRLPGLGDLPLLGRLFSNEKRTQDKTEIILAITPRVIRNLIRPSAELAEYGAGTETGRFGSGSAVAAVPPRPAMPPTPAPVQPGVVPLSGAPGTPVPMAPAGPSSSSSSGAAPASVTPPFTLGTPPSPGDAPPGAAPLGVAPPGAAAPGAVAPQPPGGVIPMINLEPPSGVGPTRGSP